MGPQHRKATVFSLLGFALMSGARRYFDGSTPPIRDKSRALVEGSIAKSEMLSLGGVDQYVLTRGWDQANPVLLVLHGGPGDSAGPLFGLRCPELEKHFVVVHWDQRGSGRSFGRHLDQRSITVDQLLADAHELTTHLRTQFSDQPIVVLGHSWGSYLGLKLVHRYPAGYAAFVGVGQVADQVESERLGYDWVVAEANRRGHRRAASQLTKLGPPHRGRYTGGLAGMGVQRRWIRQFGGAAFAKSNLAVLWLFAWPLLRCREYRIVDKVRYISAETTSMNRLQEPLLDDPPRAMLLHFEIPVFFIQGRHDRQTDVELARNYLAELSAPDKAMVVIDDAAHLAPFEKPTEFVSELIALLGRV